jgi:hypothetical protein
MKKIAIILGIFLLQSCGKTENKSVKTTLDTSQYAIIKLDSSEKSKEFKISAEDISEAEKILADCVKDYNSKQLKVYEKVVKENPEYKIEKSQFFIDLKDYKRQYIGTYNIYGGKEIFINCFCDSDNDYWRKDIVRVFDGGNCYFNLRVDLTLKRYSDFNVNGSA